MREALRWVVLILLLLSAAAEKNYGAYYRPASTRFQQTPMLLYLFHLRVTFGHEMAASNTGAQTRDAPARDGRPPF